MNWNNKAIEALSRVPFFVRKRVKKRVEEEALTVVDSSLDYYRRHCLKGERFGEILEQTPLQHTAHGGKGRV